MGERYYVADTNTILDKIEDLHEYNIVLTAPVLRELEKHKNHKNEQIAYRSRQITRYIHENKDRFKFDLKDYDGSEFGDKSYQDNNILKCLKENDYGLISGDILLCFQAEGLGIRVIYNDEINKDSSSNDYNGIYELCIDNSTESQALLAKIYENPNENIFNLKQNQYLVIWDKNKPKYDKTTGLLKGYEPIDTFKFNGERLIKLRFKNIENMYMGKVKPLNVKQSLAFDMLQSKNIGVNLITGAQGTGKDYIMLAHMLQALDKEEFNKIVFIRNIQPLKNMGETGFLKGDLEAKMKSWLLPVADAIGGEDALQMLIDRGKIEIQHGEAIRGRSYINSAVYVTECQNLTSEIVKVLLARIGYGSKLFMNGDLEQTDNSVFNSHSGIKALTKLQGNSLFGMVELDKTERSEIATLSELI